MPRFLIFLIALSLLGFACYQYMRGAVWQHTGWTKFSRVAWLSREQHPYKFWFTLLSQLIASGVLLYAVLFL